MRDNDIYFLIIIVAIVTILIGGFAGYSLGEGTTAFAVPALSEPADWNFLSGVGFLLGLMSFRVAGLPLIIGMIYDAIFVWGLTIFIFNYVRGKSG